MAVGEPAEPCTSGLLLPVWNPQEGVGVVTIIFRSVVYFMATLHMFFGVSIVADLFTAVIEMITSQEREVKLNRITGSGAPEILLSLIEIFGNNFEAGLVDVSTDVGSVNDDLQINAKPMKYGGVAKHWECFICNVKGDLGPSTIVGPAAFNLFIIIGICVYAVPSTEKRMVQHNGVFWVTVAWSTLAYIWLYLIISVFSPAVIQTDSIEHWVWEGVFTFVFFPLAVISAYLGDQYTGKLGRRLLTGARTSFLRRPESISAKHKDHPPEHRLSLLSSQRDADVVASEEHRKKYLDMFRKLRTEYPDAPAEELEKLALERVVAQEPKSRAFYRTQIH